MSEEVKVLTLDSDEQQLLVRSLYDLRSAQLQKDGPVEPVEDLLLRVIDAPTASSRTSYRSLLPFGQKLTRSVAPPSPTESADSAGALKRKRRFEREAR